MKKKELIELMLKDKDAKFESKAAAERALKSVLGAIETGIKKEGHVQLIGFGTFSVKTRPARKGRNPLTGEEIKIKASKSLGFKTGAALKATVAKAKVGKK